MRAISDYLRKEFAARGIPEITDHSLVDGQQCLSFADRTVTVSPFASDAEIKSAVFKAHGMTDDNIETVQPDTAATLPAVTPIAEPAVAVEKPKAEEPKMGGVMSKGYRPGSLKALLAGLHAEGQSIMEELAQEAAKAQQAHAKLRGVKNDLRAYRDGIMSDLGQFSNMQDED